MKKLLFLLTFFLMSTGIAFAAQVNINTADVAEIASAIDGVGNKRAQAIIDYREANGPFKSVDDLVRVKGIGKKVLEANRDNLTVDDAKETTEGQK